MLIRFRIVLLFGALIGCAVSLGLLTLRMMSCIRPAPSWAEKLCGPGMLRQLAVERNKRLFSELIRLAADTGIFLMIMHSGIYFPCFRLFPESIGGFLAGFSILISLTLLASVPVDWLQLRLPDRSVFAEKRDRRRFFRQEMLSILLAEIGMNIVLACVVGLQKLRAGIPLTVILSFLALLAYRAILHLLKNTKRQFLELPECELNTRLIGLLAEENCPVQRVLVRTGGNGSASYGARLRGLRNRVLILDRSLLCKLGGEEIISAVLFRLEMERQKLRLRELLFRGMQIAVIAVSLIVLLTHMEACSLRGEAGLTGVSDLMHLVLPLFGCFAAVSVLQVLRNLGLKRMMLSADRAVAAKGCGPHLRNALIQASELEMLNPVPAYELLVFRPEFLPFRMDIPDQTIKRKKGAK